MLVMKNTANNTMYIEQELHTFYNHLIGLQSFILKHFISINFFTTFFN